MGNRYRIATWTRANTAEKPSVKEKRDARSLQGFYGEASYRLWAGGSPRDLVGFLRYENFDTQHRMPADFVPLKEFDRDAWVVGVTYYPDPDVAVKVDYVYQRNQSPTVKAPNSFNVGLGWWF